MPKLSTKLNLLDSAGYAYNFDRMMYINRQAKKAFSVEFVDDHGEDVIERKISEANNENRWHFYFNDPPPEGIKRELERVLG